MIRKLSVVIPVFRGASTIGPLVERLEADDLLLKERELEIVLVNDGSPDNSGAVCRALANARPHVRFIDLSRNFGEHNAVMAGLNHCSGDAAVILDDDFQNPPCEVRKLVDKLGEGFDVVWSRYEVKRHGWFRNLGSRFNDSVATLMLGKPRGLYLSSFKAISRFVIDEVVRYRGPFPYLDGLVLRITRNYTTVLVQHDARQEGKSGYTLRKLVSLWLNMFTGFSVLPLRLASFAGITVALIGALLGVWFLIERLNHPEIPSGWASIIVTVLIVSGIQLLVLGVIGEYLGRLFLQDNGRQQFVVRGRVNCGGGAGDDKARNET
ncbi:MAG TPA: glycosyltransferase family 2 protein [Planctomycetota bacterium]|nr:glycosyltransferase family 2 protein [Planctomycetota bacterium]